MKRSPLRRKPHPNNPHSTFAPRAKPMNKVAPKRKSQRDALAPYRVWLKASAGCCMKCRAKRASVELDVHEIPAGAHRDRALQNPWTWLLLCRDCHDVLQGIDPQIQVEVLFAWIVDGVNDCYGRKVVTPPAPGGTRE